MSASPNSHRPSPLPSPLWQISFRPFFLAASIFITCALAIWTLVLTNAIPALTSNYQPFGGWFIWHGHEMIFGFVQAVAIGFLLTASRNWAGQPGISSAFIKLLVASWVAARIAWLIPTLPGVMLAALDATTPTLAALALAQTLKGGEKDHGKGSQRHNWPFVLLLAAFALIQLAFHLLHTYQPQYLTLLMQAAVLMMATMTLWVAGRVLPFFTRARLQAQPSKLPKGLLATAMTSSWCLIPLVILNQFFAGLILLQAITALVAVIAACSQGYRLFLFYRKGVASEAMLWSMYLAYAWMVAGYLLIAIGIFSATNLPWLHAITIGGLLTMIISMMARISLGHTGRPILALAGIPWVFAAIQAAALIRISVPSSNGYLITLILILVAMVIFLKRYLPILIKPRADGNPG